MKLENLTFTFDHSLNCEISILINDTRYMPMSIARKLRTFEKRLPAGYHLEITESYKLLVVKER